MKHRFALPALALTLLSVRAAAAPPAVRSFEAFAVSSSAIRCAWLPAAGAEQYVLRRDGQEIARLGPGAVQFDDAGLAPDSLHTYTVQASAGTVQSAASEYVERTFALFPEKETTFDVVIAQASSGGVAAAVEAGRRGLRTALIEPTTRVGGMPANGLSATDIRKPIYASGFLTRFLERVRAIYASEGQKVTGTEYEPRVAHQALKALLYGAPNVTLYRRARLASVRTAATPGGRRKVSSVTMEELDPAGAPTGRRAVLRGGYFIDATDCGDLAAWAGAPFRLGREPRSAREPHNGYIYYDRAGDRALPGSTGRGDRRIQSYAYLLTVKNYGAGTDHTIPVPPGYRREDFIHSPAWKESWAVTSGSMPGHKFELNQHPQGNDIQGINYVYPVSGYAARAAVEKRYHDHVLCYLYYIQTELGQKQVGLPDDEYRDSGGFPPLLYVREGRRILGEQLPDEASITDARKITRPESIGIGDYPMDSHAVEPKTDWDRPDMGEGEWWLYKQTPWHQLPLGVCTPRGLDNVSVTTAVSSTHVSFGTYRLEPVRMAFGQAAAISASLCLRYGLAAKDVPARQVQEELLPHAANPLGDSTIQLYYLPDISGSSPDYRAVQYLAARGFLTAGRDTLTPDGPVTRRELAGWMRLLAERTEPQTLDPGRQFTAHTEALSALDSAPDGVATRADIARAFFTVLPNIYRQPDTPGHYSDAGPVSLEAEALFGHGLDSRLWDGARSDAGGGRLLFRPEAPLTHAQMFESLYIAQIGLGPLFFDPAADFRNGRSRR